MTFAIYFWHEGRLAANRPRIEQTTVWKMIYLNVRRTDQVISSRMSQIDQK